MRSRLLTNVFTCLFLLLANTASAEEPRALLDRAIQAHGGAARIERTKKGHIKAKTEVNRLNVSYKVEIEEWFDLPNRYKRSSDISSNNTPLHREYAFTGKEGWFREGTGPVRDYPLQPLPVEKCWHAILAKLLLLRNKDVQLKSLPDETKDGRTFAGFHATSPQASSDYFFDKSTGLLVRTQTPTLNQLSREEVIEDTFYDEYRDIQGVHYPMRFKVVEGKTYSSTGTLSSIEFLDKIDDSVFTKPQTPAAEGRGEESPASDSGEKSPPPRNWLLFVATVGAGVVIGAVWFIVRVSKRGRRETPPS